MKVPCPRCIRGTLLPYDAFETLCLNCGHSPTLTDAGAISQVIAATEEPGEGRTRKRRGGRPPKAPSAA